MSKENYEVSNPDAGPQDYEKMAKDNARQMDEILAKAQAVREGGQMPATPPPDADMSPAVFPDNYEFEFLSNPWAKAASPPSKRKSPSASRFLSDPKKKNSYNPENPGFFGASPGHRQGPLGFRKTRSKKMIADHRHAMAVLTGRPSASQALTPHQHRTARGALPLVTPASILDETQPLAAHDPVHLINAPSLGSDNSAQLAADMHYHQHNIDDANRHKENPTVHEAIEGAIKGDEGKEQALRNNYSTADVLQVTAERYHDPKTQEMVAEKVLPPQHFDTLKDQQAAARETEQPAPPAMAAAALASPASAPTPSWMKPPVPNRMRGGSSSEDEEA